MKLHYNPASPYVRKVRAMAAEAGLGERIELVPERVSPVTSNEALNSDNPIGKIPALVLDDGTTLFDSRVICEYLDSLHDGKRMFPAEGTARWKALRLQALADGILDAAVVNRYETFLRPEKLRWPEWIEGQKSKFRRGLDALEAEADSLGDGADIGTLSVACALGYLDFRYADENWRKSHPKLAKWFEKFSKRKSLSETMPADLR